MGIDKTRFMRDNKHMENTGIKEISMNELYDLLLDTPCIGFGANGKVFDIGNDEIFKFNYAKFNLVGGKELRKQLNLFRSEIGKHLKELQDIKNTILYKIVQLYGKIKRAALPKTILFCEGARVGTIADRVEGTDLRTAIDSLKKNDIETRRIIEKNVYEAYQELLAHNVFAFDIKTNNLVVNPENGDAIVIDCDDDCTYIGGGNKVADELQKKSIMDRVTALLAICVERNTNENVRADDLLFRRIK